MGEYLGKQSTEKKIKINRDFITKYCLCFSLLMLEVNHIHCIVPCFIHD